MFVSELRPATARALSAQSATRRPFKSSEAVRGPQLGAEGPFRPQRLSLEGSSSVSSVSSLFTKRIKPQLPESAAAMLCCRDRRGHFSTVSLADRWWVRPDRRDSPTQPAFKSVPECRHLFVVSPDASSTFISVPELHHVRGRCSFTQANIFLQ